MDVNLLTMSFSENNENCYSGGRFENLSLILTSKVTAFRFDYFYGKQCLVFDFVIVLYLKKISLNICT